MFTFPLLQTNLPTPSLLALTQFKTHSSHPKFTLTKCYSLILKESLFTKIHHELTHLGPDFFHPFPHFATMAIHAGQDPKQWNCRAVVPLISLSTTFQQDFPGELSVYGGLEASRA